MKYHHAVLHTFSMALGIANITTFGLKITICGASKQQIVELSHTAKTKD